MREDRPTSEAISFDLKLHRIHFQNKIESNALKIQKAQILMPRRKNLFTFRAFSKRIARKIQKCMQKIIMHWCHVPIMYKNTLKHSYYKWQIGNSKRRPKSMRIEIFRTRIRMQVDGLHCDEPINSNNRIALVIGDHFKRSEIDLYHFLLFSFVFPL